MICIVDMQYLFSTYLHRGLVALETDERQANKRRSSFGKLKCGRQEEPGKKNRFYLPGSFCPLFR
ncbi:unnamed protein product [Acanthoscelides obtectus]|uniref:Uncharacterized protein n=1 Tax=Acanthoscelides obtectus TaxID=200917 RepID=A0A9P0KUH4_ACAOB|nr:unnamed protein product [Acanthoscelides obtectus]CAK1662952.1 hypothetical protein AOBTE_LOCUS23392 [Acanthoscelides obtectus]